VCARERKRDGKNATVREDEGGAMRDAITPGIPTTPSVLYTRGESESRSLVALAPFREKLVVLYLVLSRLRWPFAFERSFLSRAFRRPFHLPLFRLLCPRASHLFRSSDRKSTALRRI
jgi:hypothetical protein